MSDAARDTMRRGWCPGVLRPMMARDGLIVRLRLTAGILPATTARALADLAERHGNGLFDLSGRANLQMRGVAASAWPALVDALRALDLLDADAGAEAVRNVLVSPLAGLEATRPDLRLVTGALEAALVAEPALRLLPPKFGFLLDDGVVPGLADIASDVRFDWHERGAFAVGLGGSRASAAFAGWCDAAAIVPRAIALATTVAAVQPADGRPLRLAALLRSADGALRRRLGLDGDATAPVWPREPAIPPFVGLQTIGDMPVLGLAAPFGRLDAAMLAHAASLAGADGLRLSPWRALLLPRPAAVPDDVPGFITDPSDPRLRVAACVGADGCERGTTPTHADAAALAALAATLGPEATPLHVSGCAKGCAKPTASAVTLVGRDGRYDLVRAGRSGDRPALLGLDRDRLATILAAEALAA